MVKTTHLVYAVPEGFGLDVCIPHAAEMQYNASPGDHVINRSSTTNHLPRPSFGPLNYATPPYSAITCDGRGAPRSTSDHERDGACQVKSEECLRVKSYRLGAHNPWRPMVLGEIEGGLDPHAGPREEVVIRGRQEVRGRPVRSSFICCGPRNVGLDRTTNVVVVLVFVLVVLQDISHVPRSVFVSPFDRGSAHVRWIPG